MANSLYPQFGNNAPMNPMLKRFLEFRKSFNGNPQQIIQNMLNSGKLTQSQLNNYTQQANSLYQQFKPFM